MRFEAVLKLTDRPKITHELRHQVNQATNFVLLRRRRTLSILMKFKLRKFRGGVILGE